MILSHDNSSQRAHPPLSTCESSTLARWAVLLPRHQEYLKITIFSVASHIDFPECLVNYIDLYPCTAIHVHIDIMNYLFRFCFDISSLLFIRHHVGLLKISSFIHFFFRLPLGLLSCGLVSLFVDIAVGFQSSCVSIVRWSCLATNRQPVFFQWSTCAPKFRAWVRMPPVYCYLTGYACVNLKMAHWKSRCKRDMVTITKWSFYLLTYLLQTIKYIIKPLHRILFVSCFFDVAGS